MTQTILLKDHGMPNLPDQANGTPNQVMVVGLHHLTVNELVRGERALIRVGDDSDHEIVNVALRFMRPFEPPAPVPDGPSNQRPRYAERPAHDGSVRKTYYGDGEQPWDVMRRKGWAAAFAGGNVLKYLRRTKNTDDPDKARWYWTELHLLIKNASAPSEKVWAQMILVHLKEELSALEVATLGNVESADDLTAPASVLVPTTETAT